MTCFSDFEKVVLTKGELDAVLHRLEVHDALAEVLCDTHAEMEGKEDEVAEAVEALANRCRKFGYILFDPKNMVEVEALADAIEGSTYVGAASGAYHASQAQAAAYRVLSSAAEKIGKAIGRDLEVPVG